MDPITQHVSLPDGSHVVAKFFMPADGPRAAVVLPCAMGVTQKYYRDFAEWLASQGFAAITFDYRGMGLSAPKSLKNCKVNISDWAAEDCAAIVATVKTQVPDRQLFWMGHSLGGQLVGMIPNRELIDGVILVASGNGYWKTTSPQTHRNSVLMFYVLAPLFTPLFGYFPGKRLRAVGDLPAGVIHQWRRWCLNPEYMMVEGGTIRQDFADVRTPMLSISFTDDEMMSATSTEGLLAFYSSAPIEKDRLSPSDVGTSRIGHFGFFRKQAETSLWPRVTNWLTRRHAA